MNYANYFVLPIVCYFKRSGFCVNTITPRTYNTWASSRCYVLIPLNRSSPNLVLHFVTFPSLHSTVHSYRRAKMIRICQNPLLPFCGRLLRLLSARLTRIIPSARAIKRVPFICLFTRIRCSIELICLWHYPLNSRCRSVSIPKLLLS